jgi:integrase
MPKLRPNSTPDYRLHRPSGRAVVTLNDSAGVKRDHYLGKYSKNRKAASRVEYDRLISQWLANGRRLPDKDGEQQVSVNEVLAEYMTHAVERYGKRSRNELGCLRDALAVVRRVCGREPAREFGPKLLKLVRQRMLREKNWSRTYTNHQIQRVRRTFRWCVGEELIPGEVLHRLAAVDGLRFGEPGTRESAAVKPVCEEHVARVLPWLTPQVQTIVRLLQLTAARVGEIACTRTCDVDTSGAVWVFTPVRHKLQVHGLTRRIFIGPRAQQVLKPWLRVNVEEYLFQPREAAEWLARVRRKDRKTALCRSWVKIKAQEKRRRKRIRFQVHYSTNAVTCAIRRACLKAGVPIWSAGQLRHSAATALGKNHSIETVRVILGHTSIQTSQVYTEIDTDRAVAAVAAVG